MYLFLFFLMEHVFIYYVGYVFIFIFPDGACVPLVRGNTWRNTVR